MRMLFWFLSENGTGRPKNGAPKPEHKTHDAGRPKVGMNTPQTRNFDAGSYSHRAARG